MSVVTDREWEERMAKQLALANKRITALEEENAELKARVHALESRVDMHEAEREEEWP